jgi:hypothetical protein
MDYQQLAYDLPRSASVQLLRSPHAPLLLSFLHRCFKAEQRISVPYAELLGRLERELEALNDEQPGLLTQSATAYLKQWSDEDHRFIRILVRGSGDEPQVELTVDSERALGWVEELYRQEFVGTESRFLTIFRLLEEIVTRSTEDVQTRLAQLEAERDAIQQQIETIRATGQVVPYTPTQIKERFLQASEVARQLVRDFAAVEQNFRALARNVQTRQLQPDARRGAVVGYVLDSDAELRESDQGRSFYAFWAFLLSPAQQDALARLLSEAYALPVLQDIAADYPLLRRIRHSLIDAGERIVQSNLRLSEQLRRLLDDRALAESRRIRALINAIKQLAFEHGAVLNAAAFLTTIEGDPDVLLVMDKPLYERGTQPTIAHFPAVFGTADLTNADLQALYAQSVVDTRQLQRQIDAILDQQSSCTLGEVLERYPVQQGLAEVIGYVVLAAGSEQHMINGEASEVIRLTDGDGVPRLLTIPHILFRKAYVH